MPEAAGRYARRVAVVSGARRGIGKAIAAHFLAEGAHVVGFARHETTLAHERYLHFAVDVGDDDAVRAAFRTIARRFSALDILVNSAGVVTAQHALLMPAARARDMVTTNILGTLFMSREAAKLMRRRKYGRIINIGSMAAVLEPQGDSVYAATKAAAATLAGVLAKELAGFNITCNTLGVSAFASDMLAQLDREHVEAVMATLPQPRLATADDILNVIDFFASEHSGAVTAQTVYLGGVH